MVGEILKDKQRNLTTSMAAFYVREGGPDFKKIALKTFFQGGGRLSFLYFPFYVLEGLTNDTKLKSRLNSYVDEISTPNFDGAHKNIAVYQTPHCIFPPPYL